MLEHSQSLHSAEHVAPPRPETWLSGGAVLREEGPVDLLQSWVVLNIAGRVDGGGPSLTVPGIQVGLGGVVMPGWDPGGEGEVQGDGEVESGQVDGSSV